MVNSLKDNEASELRMSSEDSLVVLAKSGSMISDPLGLISDPWVSFHTYCASTGVVFEILENYFSMFAM